MIKSKFVEISTKIPIHLKKSLSDYCKRSGVTLQIVLTEAIQGRLNEAREEEHDNAIVNERLKNPQYSTKGEFLQYVTKRKKKF